MALYLSPFPFPSSSPSPSPSQSHSPSLPSSASSRHLRLLCYAFPRSKPKPKPNSKSNSKPNPKPPITTKFPGNSKMRNTGIEKKEEGEERRRRHWKAGEFPSNGAILKKTEKEKEKEEERRRRHWKAGEFPGVSLSEEAPHGHGNRKLPSTPIKNLKKKMENRERSRAWVCTVTEALSDSIRLKDWERALQIFGMLQQQPFYEPKEGTYMKLLLLLGKSSQPHRAHQLFDEMLLEGLQPTPGLYTALLASYCRNNLIEEGFQVLHTMKALPLCQPDVYTYSTLIKACVDGSRFDLVDSLYEEMAERNVTPNTVTQNTVLSGYGKAGKFDEMERVLAGMLENSNSKPDVWTMNIILGLFGNMGQVENMEKWYEKFRNYGIEPETRTFNILIGAYGKKKMYDKMSAVMEHMRKLEFPWTSSTYNNIIEAFAEVGDARNLEYSFNQMRAENMKPDTRTFCCLINGYSNAGLFNKVVTTIQFAERNEVHANTAFHNAVLSACVKAGDLLEMERVFKCMKERGCVPNDETYGILIDAYRKEGMHDKIFDLEQSDPTRFADVHVSPVACKS